MPDRSQDLAASHFRNGDLQGALDAVTELVRGAPSDAGARVFLSQLLMIQGAWERALAQLSVVAELDASAIPMKQAYSAAIQCERVREAVFAGQRSPLVLGEPPRWIALQLRGLELYAKGQFEEAKGAREEAWEAAPELKGEINGDAFSMLSDSDVRIGPVVEALLEGSYYWVPMERIQQVTLEPPEDARDLVWLPAQFVWDNGGSAVGFIPSRYPGAVAAGDEFALSRRTEWLEEPHDCVVGLGQRVWATDDADYSLFEVRDLQISV